LLAPKLEIVPNHSPGKAFMTTTLKAPEPEIPLMDACAELHIPYHTGLRFVLTGTGLRGRKVNGRWWVAKASVAAMRSGKGALAGADR
jgi:hypothetical protein